MTNASLENGASVENNESINGQDNGKRRLTKNEKRRLREKSKEPQLSNNTASDQSTLTDDENIVIEYISPNINLEEELADAQVLNDFKSIFQKFAKAEDLVNASSAESKAITNQQAEEDAQQIIDSTNPSEPQKLSKKKLKLASRLSVAELKQLVSRPDVVEAHDVTSSDPRLLVMLKAMRNTVPVPRHWCAKRKYLQGKRGIEKVPFQLPEFIAETGIAKIRESVIEQENLRKSKQKARERMQPKMGKIDIDYQVLHDAFFKYQTKPKMTIHGDLYYEGKEFEVS
jgi:splicing factor 3B subunit 2